MTSIDLNADMGEGMPNDAALLNIVSSASIACGGHAGDVATMRETLTLAKDLGVVTGAHPGFADRENFGRRRLHLSPEELWSQIYRQIEALSGIAAEVGQLVSYVKLHGALYNMASADHALCLDLFGRIRDAFGPMAIMALDGSAQVAAANQLGMPVIREAFADRSYSADGYLTPRSEPHAVLHETGQVSAQAIGIARDRTITAHNGTVISTNAQSICLHGDNEAALTLARAVRSALEAEGVTVRAPDNS